VPGDRGLAIDNAAECRVHEAAPVGSLAMTTRTRIISSIRAAVHAAALMVTAHTAMAQTVSSGPPGSPAIVLPGSLLSGTQPADAPIDIKFVTTPDTAVDLTSLHIWVHQMVGWVEVTERLLRLPQVHVSGWGIHLEGGVLPPGEHEVRLSFQDLKGRVVDATRTIRILRIGSRI
jgi:hypothetical protein